MDSFSEEERQRLMEEIKKVEIKERKVPPRFDTYVEHRYLDSSIVNAGEEAIAEFFKVIGEGSFNMSSWIRKGPVKEAAKKFNLTIMRNKKRGSGGYVVFSKKPKTEDILTFDPKMLMVDKDDKESIKT